jgi:hypothetical protein
MSTPVTFVVLPLDSLRAHEKIVPSKVVDLVAELQQSGVFVDPIWVSRGTDVILNGHHRVAALRQLGAQRVPAWVVDYDSDIIRLERWTPGPPVSKAEVVRRAEAGELFPPQTTRHILSTELPRRSTPLRDLLSPNPHPSEAAPSPDSDTGRRS